MKQKKKVLFVLPSLADGGAERIAAMVVSRLNREYFDPVLILFKASGEYFHMLPNDLKIIELKKKNRFDIFGLIFKLSRVIKSFSPCTVISFLSYANIISIVAILLNRKRQRLVISERNNPIDCTLNERLGWIKFQLMKRLYHFADKVIVISKGIKECFVEKVNFPPEKIKVVYNPIDLEMVRELSSESLGIQDIQLFHSRPVVVAMGRLTRQKNFTLLLESFALLKKNRHPSASLILLGKGELEAYLHDLAEKLMIDSSVFFLGFKKNPFPYIKNSDMFVLSSDWEGFGNVITEAAACGVPVISTDCPYGPGEIITNDVDGILVPTGDVEKLCHAMDILTKNEELRSRLVRNAFKSLERFRFDLIVHQYEEEL